MCSEQYLACGKAQKMLAIITPDKIGSGTVSCLVLHPRSRHTYPFQMEP